MSAANQKDSYNSDSIVALNQHQHLLKRLSLTFGSETGTDKNPYSSQKTISLREITDNSLDEIRSGYGTHMRVSFFKDGSVEVQDSGRGIPVDVSKDGNGRKVSGIFKSLGIIQSGGKFVSSSNKYTSGLNGVGSSSTIHVSKRADVTVYRDGKKYELSFKDGTPGFFEIPNNPESDFVELKDYSVLLESKDTRPAGEKKNYASGTTVRVWLRDEVFQSEYPFDHQDLIARLKSTAFLVPQLHVEVYNELLEIENPATGSLEPQHEFYHFENGLDDLIALNQADTPLFPPIKFSTVGSYTEKNVPVLRSDGTVVGEDLERKIPIEVAICYGDKYDYSMHSYVNTINTKLGGVHETAFERALVKVFGAKIESMRGLLSKDDGSPIVDDFREGLTAVLSCQIAEPQFTSQSKEQLGGKEVSKAVFDVLVEEFERWIKSPKNSDILQVLARKVAAATKSRRRAQEQKEVNRKKNEIKSAATLPVKLSDCELAGTDEAELFIVEGDSAKGTVKAARDARRVAVMPIRGKMLNTLGESQKKILDNKEISDIIQCMGMGFGDSCNIDDARYGRVMIGVDADPDGQHIACLILILFWTIFRPYVEAGKLYMTQSPLFIFNTKEGKNSRHLYAMDESEKVTLQKQLNSKKIDYTITRCKGLGELSAEAYYETAINPETRILKQINIGDIVEAEKFLDLAFGSDTDARKAWIRENPPEEELE